MGAGIQTPPPAYEEEEKEGCTLNIPEAPGGAALIPTESYKAFCPPRLPQCQALSGSSANIGGNWETGQNR